jgi:hypothetical protein
MVALKPAVAAVSRSAMRLSSATPSAANACGAEQGQEGVDEAVVLDQIAGHHRVGHSSGKKLPDEAMPHGLRPVGLTRGAQGFGESLGHALDGIGRHWTASRCPVRERLNKA